MSFCCGIFDQTVKLETVLIKINLGSGGAVSKLTGISHRKYGGVKKMDREMHRKDRKRLRALTIFLVWDSSLARYPAKIKGQLAASQSL